MECITKSIQLISKSEVQHKLPIIKKLEERRKDLFNNAIQAFEDKSKRRASVYESEHSELDNVVQTIANGELALTQLNVRLESIKHIDDMYL